jgi:hypothetical protein
LTVLTPKRVVTFKCFKNLKNKINAQKETRNDRKIFKELIKNTIKGIIKAEKLAKILEDHRLWLQSKRKKGERARLKSAKLMKSV